MVRRGDNVYQALSARLCWVSYDFGRGNAGEAPLPRRVR